MTVLRSVIVLSVYLFVALGPTFVSPPGAQAFDESVKAAIEDVISQQMSAFKKDDAAGAHHFASPSIKALFPDPLAFLDMVRRSYSPVYRPRKITFGDLRESSQGLNQFVSIIDADGVVWTAVYSMVLLDGEWLINGCYLLKLSDSA